MNNIERQKQLDQDKYLESLNKGQDMSGKMIYCTKCEYRTPLFNDCKISHEERTSQCACAEAFNKIKPKKKKM